MARGGHTPTRVIDSGRSRARYTTEEREGTARAGSRAPRDPIPGAGVEAKGQIRAGRGASEHLFRTSLPFDTCDRGVTYPEH